MKDSINILLILVLTAFMFVIHDLAKTYPTMAGWFILGSILAILLGMKIHEENQNPQNRK